MGLPIWRDPDEKKSSGKNAARVDPTACLRSSIRRRPSVHGRRSTRARLPRDPSVLPPRFERSPPPSVGFNGLRESRRGEERGVPPISRLLEAADRPRDGTAAPRPPPPAPESPDYNQRIHELEIMNMQNRNANLLPGSPEQLLAEMEIRNLQRQELERRRALLEARHRARLSEWRSQTPLDAVDVSDGEGHEFEENRALRRSPTPPANRDDPTVSMHAITINPGEPLRNLRSPEPMHNRRRPDSRDGGSARRSTLPTPPLDTSGPEDGLFVTVSDESPPRPGIRRSHPLSNSWRPESPVNGLGDRDRSPESADAWAIMRTTITPDESLPSAESSFASAAASQSFNASSNDTQITEPSAEDSGSDTSSSVNLDDVCTEEEVFSTEAFASDIYHNEMRTPEGRERIAHHFSIRRREGNRFALSSEPVHVDIGFRLIEEALETEEGRRRVLEVRHNSPEDMQHFQDVLAATQRVRDRRSGTRRPIGRAWRSLRPTLEEIEASGERVGTMDRYVERRPQNHSQEIRNAAREASGQVEDYFRRFADTMEPRTQPTSRAPSPPPQYESNTQDGSSQISREGSEQHPVSPPSNRSEREVSEALLSGDVQDLDSMRRVVERLAARDDVPEEWWMSMGLNISRARPRDRSPRRRTVVAGPDDTSSATSRVRSGRIDRHERGNARL